MVASNFNFERWTPFDDEQLTSLFRQGASDDHIATTLHRSKSSVSQRRVKLRLPKRDETTTCPRCLKALSFADGLRWCEGCGYEAPLSAERPIRPPHETDDEPNVPLQQRVQQAVAAVQTRKEPEVTDIETIARQSLQRVTEEMSGYELKLEELGAEKAKLNRVLAALEPRPGFSCPHCGRVFQAKNNLGGHITVKHPGGQA